MSSRIKVGLIGFGMGGQIFHAPLIDYTEGLELYAIRESKEPNIAIIKDKYPTTLIVSEADEIISDPQIDLVVISIPNQFHYDIAKRSLLAGKHVVLDKPFTVTTVEADELIALAKEREVILSVFQNRRWDADFLTVREVIDSGALSEIAEYEAHYDRWRNHLRANTWKEDGALGTGLLYDLGSHLIDQALVLFGLPNSITAFLAQQRADSAIVDNFLLLLHYDGLRVTLKSSLLVKEEIPRYIVLGRQGSFVKYGLDVQEAALAAGYHPGEGHWGIEPEDKWGVLHIVQNEEDRRLRIESEPGDYPAYYQNIYESIVSQQPLSVTAEQAREVIYIIECAMKSHELQKTIHL